MFQILLMLTQNLFKKEPQRKYSRPYLLTSFGILKNPSIKKNKGLQIPTMHSENIHIHLTLILEQQKNTMIEELRKKTLETMFQHIGSIEIPK